MVTRNLNRVIDRRPGWNLQICNFDYLSSTSTTQLGKDDSIWWTSLRWTQKFSHHFLSSKTGPKSHLTNEISFQMLKTCSKRFKLYGCLIAMLPKISNNIYIYISKPSEISKLHQELLSFGRGQTIQSASPAHWFRRPEILLSWNWGNWSSAQISTTCSPKMPLIWLHWSLHVVIIRWWSVVLFS